MKEIISGVFIEDEYEGVTLGAIQTAKGVIMIDAPLSVKDAQIWRSNCSHSSGGSDRLLVLLDEHFDRCIGARALRCPIVAHEKTAQTIANRNSIGKPQAGLTGALWETSSEVNSINWTHPEITFTNEMSINWDAEPLVLEHHPGPSRGSIWALLPERKVAFIGDTVINDQPPFLAAADISAWENSLELLKSNIYKDFILIGSRSSLVTKDDIRSFQKFLNKVERLAEKQSVSKSDLAHIEEIGASLAEDFRAKNRLQAEVFRNRLAHGFSQYCLNILSKKNP